MLHCHPVSSTTAATNLRPRGSTGALGSRRWTCSRTREKSCHGTAGGQHLAGPLALLQHCLKRLEVWCRWCTPKTFGDWWSLWVTASYLSPVAWKGTEVLQSKCFLANSVQLIVENGNIIDCRSTSPIDQLFPVNWVHVIPKRRDHVQLTLDCCLELGCTRSFRSVAAQVLPPASRNPQLSSNSRPQVALAMLTQHEQRCSGLPSQLVATKSSRLWVPSMQPLKITP